MTFHHIGDAIGSLIIIALGLVLSISAYRALKTAGLILFRRTQSINNIKEGPVEIQGTVRISEQSLETLSKSSAVAIRTELEIYIQGSKGGNWHRAGVVTRAVPCEISDGTDKAMIVVEDPEVIGESYQTHTSLHTIRTLNPTLAERLQAAFTPPVLQKDKPLDLFSLRLIETPVLDGAKVLVSGRAFVGGTSSGIGYRDGRTQYSIGDTNQQALLISTLSHHRTLWRAAWPAIISGIFGLTVTVMGTLWALLSVMLGEVVR